MKLELCFLCDRETGRAGASDDSIYDEQGDGPYCQDCWEAYCRGKSRIATLEAKLAEARGQAACDACAGAGKAESGECMCGGSGLAIDAVDYLRKRLAEARADLRCSNSNVERQSEQLDELRAEVERLRADGERIREAASKFTTCIWAGSTYNVPCGLCPACKLRKAIDAARATTKESPQ